MYYFCKTLSLFLAPFALIFTPAVCLLYQAGELHPLTNVIHDMNMRRIVLYGPAYSNPRQELQRETVSRRRPEVLALGNSRVGEFRDAFFKDAGVFYNATGAISAMTDFIYFLEAIGPHQPRILIANVDHYYFNPEQAKNNVVARSNPFITSVRWPDVAVEALFRNGGWWKVYRDYLQDKFTLADVFRASPEQKKMRGLRALVERTGALYDGSDYYGKTIATQALQEEVRESIRALAASISPQFGDWYGSGISEDAITELHRFLAYCKKQNMFVIGFLPPIAKKEYERIHSFQNATYDYARTNLASILGDTYKMYGFDFYDFSDIARLGSSDDEMIDSKHGSEKLYARMIVRMAAQSPILSPYIDQSSLSVRLRNATSSLVIFGLRTER